MHLSGIIPIANYEIELETDYPELLTLVDDKFNLIQKSVFECASAGCNTIWIVANDNMAPIIRKVVGEWIHDPVYYKRDLESKFYSQLRREIPIYYVGIKPKDMNRRDSYGWSILEGMHASYMTAYRISKWLIPEKYFVSFPFGVFDTDVIRQNRKLIKDKKKNLFFTHKNKNLLSNDYLPFTLTGDDFIKCRRNVNKKTTREFLPPLQNEKYPTQRLPLSQRWSARFFSLYDIFEPLAATDNRNLELDWYYDVSSWQGYVDYIKSENLVKKPFDAFIKPHKHERIPYEEE
jgi:hypothetical protein